MLKLRMKPNEKVLLNGSVISNGGNDPITLILHNEASVIIRETDIMKKLPDTPNVYQHLYFLSQNVYISGCNILKKELLDELDILIEMFPEFVEFVTIKNFVIDGKYYNVIKELKKWRGNELST